MRYLPKILICVALVPFAGCGNSTVETSIKVTTPVAMGEEALKPFLEDLVAKGQPLGSGGMVMQQYVDQISQKDPSKAQALQKHVDPLMSLQDPNKIKAKAKEMLEILKK